MCLFGTLQGWDVIEDMPEFQTAWLQSLPEGQEKPLSIEKKENNSAVVYPDRVSDSDE